MKSPVLLKFLALLSIFASLLFSQSANALTVQDVRFGHYPDKTRLVIDLDRPAQFRSFVLPNPYRMVIDLPAFSWNGQSIYNEKAAGITAVRHGNLKPGISRIVFDLNRPVAIHSAFTLPAASGKPNRLVIDFANTSASGFAAAQNQILGNLNVDNVQQLSAAAPPPRPPQQTKQKPLIIIDPGHGGVDPGAIGANGVFEKHVALALSKELKKQLEASGKYRVKMTRNDDTFIKLSNRVKYARKHQGDLFISIHADSLRDSNVSGASVYTLSEKASDAQTAKLAARENKADLIAGIELEVEDEAVMDILIDIARRDTQNQSKFFANTLVKDFNSNSIKTLKRPHRYANFAVLKAPEIPSVLVEAGFMSNKKEANKLNTSTHRKKIASALKQGIDTYFKTIKDNERS
jgi:N-acetylmuramoyl-L-alanine amidase